MNLALWLARRFRRFKNVSGYLSFISRSSTLGIALGCAILILLLSVMNGFQKVLEEDLLSLVPQVEFESVHGPLRDWRRVAAQVEQDEQVLAAAPVTRFAAMVQQQRRFHGIEVRAIVPELEVRVSRLADFTAAADWQDFVDNENGVLLGQGLAEQLGLNKGDVFTLMVPNLVADGQHKQAPKPLQLTYLGAIVFGGELDFRQAYMHLSKIQQLFATPDAAHAVRLKIADIYQAPYLANQLGFSLDEYTYIHNWTRTEGHLYRDIQLVRAIMYLVLLLVLAVASFNIVATLMMQVEEKRAAIAILKTMGASDGLVLRTFVWQGALNGIPGACVGALLGCGLTWLLPRFLTAWEHWLGAPLLAQDIYFVSRIPVDLQLSNVLLVMATAIVMSLVATLYPALQASRLPPVESLRQV